MTVFARKSSYMYPWSKRTLFLGALPAPVNVTYGAATLVVSLGNCIRFSLKNGVLQEGYSLLIPAGLPVWLDCGDETIAICHLDVLGQDYSRFEGCFPQAQRSNALAVSLCDEADYRELFRQMHAQPATSAQAWEMLDGILEYSFKRAENKAIVDPQIEAAIAHIKQNFDENMSVDEIAARVNLSVPTLIRKFKQQSGVPIRRFRLWHRLYESMLFVGAGQSLTEAALNSGFSDSPHFTHSFSFLWGVSPSDLFFRGIGAQLIPPVHS